MAPRFRVLGPVAVDGSDGPAGLGGPKQRAVLAALLLRVGRVVPEEQLFELVWGDDPPPSIRGRLQVHVSELRKLLGRDVIVRSGTGYRIAVAPEDIDLGQFEQACALAADAEPAEAARHLRRALDLWSGPARGGTTEALQEREGRALEERRLVAVEDRYDAELAAGNHAAVLGDLRAVVAEHPFRERLHAQLMLALHRAGQTSDALRVYRDIRARLRTELGIDPGAQLAELHQRILAGESIAVEPVAGAPIRPAELPPDVAGFAGRRAALAALSEVPVPGVVVVSGTGGVGKSALAVHWAHAARHRFPDGQLHLDLHGFDGDHEPLTPDAALAQLLRTLGLAPDAVPDTLAEKERRYRSLLADRTMLLLLDDARDAEQVMPLLPPSGLAVITSRTRLGELVAAVGARSLPLDVLPDAEAHALLTGMLGAQRVAGEPEAVAELIRLCGALPLALRIAAVNAVAEGVVEVVAALGGDDRLAEFAVDGGESSAVRAAFALSYRALRPDAARLFRVLGLLPGGAITPHAAAALADLPVPEASRALRALVAAHLLDRSAPNRYRMHELVRLFAAERVSAEEREAAMARLVDHYVSTMDKVAELTGAALTRIERDFPVAVTYRVDLADERAAAAWADVELPAMIALCRQAVDNDPSPAVWHLVDVVRKAASDRHRALWRRAAPVMLAAARRNERTDVVAVLELTLGVAEFRGGNTERGIQLLTDAAASARRAGLDRGEANAEMNLGSALQWVGRLDEAVEHGRRAEELNRRIGAHAGICAALTLLISVHRDRGDLAEAQRCGELALELGAEHDLGFWAAAASSELGVVMMQRGQFGRARELLDASLATMRRIGHQYGQLVASRDLVELDLNEHGAAGLDTDAKHCLELAERDGDRTTLVLVLSVLGRVETELDRSADALETLARARELADELGLRGYQVEVRAAIARAVARAGRVDEAVVLAEEAVGLARGSGYRVAEADAVTTLAWVRGLAGSRDAGAVEGVLGLWRGMGHVVGERFAVRLLAS